MRDAAQFQAMIERRHHHAMVAAELILMGNPSLAAHHARLYAEARDRAHTILEAAERSA